MRKFTVNGGNLFRIAAEHLGSATQWIRIARLNALSDPQLDASAGPFTLKLPDRDASIGDGGGIAPQ